MLRKIFILSVFMAFTGGDLFAQMHVEGNFSMAPDAKVGIAGDFSSDADIHGEGLLVLNGTSGPQYLGLNGHALPNLDILNPSGVLLTSSAVIVQSMVFTKGKLGLGNHSLSFAPGATHSGSNAENYLVTDGTGVIHSMELAHGQSFIFPVGPSTSAGYFMPAVITNLASDRTFSVRATSDNTVQNRAQDADNALNGAWQISSDKSGEATLALTHSKTIEGPKFNNGNAFIFQQGSGKTGNPGLVATDAAYGFTHSGIFEIPSDEGDGSFFFKSSTGNPLIITVIPNPLGDAANLRIDAQADGEIMYLVTDEAGKTVATKRLAYPKGTSYNPLPVRELAAGTYWLVVPGTGVEAVKMVKQ